jgi:membrane-associated phospholipid phosphatase
MILKKIFDELTLLGGILFYLLFMLILFLSGEYTYCFFFGLALILIYFITFIIRLFYFKQRPNKANYRNFLEKIDASSFPSIHAARSTFIFIFLVFFYSKIYYLIPLYTLLFLGVLFSRIYLKKHDYIDLFGGIIMGILLSLLYMML